jgi:tetratricopeptide (TPR) repeat protein/tRNA A-37 threonylcarbamoyl transferase component Bud32
MAEFQQTPGSAPIAGFPYGTKVGRFIIAERLGKGGMGEVYRADDTRLNRVVALKRLAPDLRSDSMYRRRFMEEAKRASRFSDSHIAAVYDVLEDQGEIFLVMEYVEGQTLRERMSEPLSVDQFFDIARQTAEALSAAHELGIIHCDIKPENIMLTHSGQVKILDFGLAKYLPRSDQSSTVDRSGTMGGTPAYMSPEVLLEKIPDARTDVFSLGVVFYEMLSGHHPFLSTSFVATTDRIRNEEPAPIHTFNSVVPDGLEALVFKALAKDPTRRYASARELLDDLNTVQAGLTPTKLRPLLQSTRRRRKLAWVVGSLLTLVIIAGGFAYWELSRPPVIQERGWLLVGDFDVQGQDPIPAASVREGLTIALQQSHYFNVFPRRQLYEVLQRMKKPETARIDEDLGREVCRRENVQVLLTGTVEKVEGTFQITVRAIDPARGNLLFAEQQRFSEKEKFFDQADLIARKVRHDLGESVRRIEQSSRPLAKVTTNSLDALQLYSEASDFMAHGKVEPVPPLLQGALQLDPNFAMAHWLMARAYLGQGNGALEAEHLARAYDWRSGTTDREQRLIEANYYSSRGQFDKQVDALIALVGLYPDDLEARNQLALAYYSVGELGDAIRETREVLKRDPSSPSPPAHLALLLARNNQGEEATQVYQDAVSRGLGSQELTWALGLARLGRDDIQGARKAFSELNGAGFQWVGQVYIARVAAYEGKFEEAEALLTRQIQTDLHAKNASAVLLERYLLTSTLLVQEKRSRARETLHAILMWGEPEELQAEDLRRAGTLFARMGDVQEARRVLTTLESLKSASPDSFNVSCYHNLAGEVDQAEGKARDAVQEFAAAYAARPQAISVAGLARSREQLGDWQAAAEQWMKILGLKGEILQDYFPLDWEISYMELGRSNQEQGLNEAARANYEKFLELWSKGDYTALRTDALKRREQVAVTSLVRSYRH